MVHFNGGANVIDKTRVLYGDKNIYNLTGAIQWMHFGMGIRQQSNTGQMRL